MTTILQISDAHLSTRNTLFRRNMALIAAWAQANRPDVVIATGDLSLDGADHPDDLALAMQMLRAVPGRLLAIPGNHDTGSHPRTMPTQPATAERLARFRDLVGPDRWVEEVPGWRLVGLNTEIMGMELEADAQAAFIADAAAGAGDRRIALFLHKPVHVTTRDDPQFDYWSVPPVARPALAPLRDHPGLRLVASGHLHLYRDVLDGRVREAWAPALSFVVNLPDQPDLPGERVCGALVHRLGADAVTTELLVPPGTELTWLDDVRDQTYPRPS